VLGTSEWLLLGVSGRSLECRHDCPGGMESGPSAVNRVLVPARILSDRVGSGHLDVENDVKADQASVGAFW
jgi:hypothetical protein